MGIVSFKELGGKATVNQYAKNLHDHLDQRPFFFDEDRDLKLGIGIVVLLQATSSFAGQRKTLRC